MSMPAPALSGLVIAAEAGYKPGSVEPCRIRFLDSPVPSPRRNPHLLGARTG